MVLRRCQRSIGSRCHRVNVRTTKLVEQSFVEDRHRTNVIPRLLDDESAMKRIFATLIRTAECWSQIAISDLERHLLRLLRQEPGIDPPPTDNRENKTLTEETVAA